MKLDDSEWPLFGRITDIRPALAEARTRKQLLVLGTLVGVRGSSPRPPGTQMLFECSRATGYFSGGCLETDVANHAEKVRADGRPRLLRYGDGSPWLDIRLLCGGSLDIMLERLDPDDPAIGNLLTAGAGRCPVMLTSDGLSRSTSISCAIAPFTFDGRTYALGFDPAWRVMIVGGDPIALAIAEIAAVSGFDTTLIRPFGPMTPPPIANIRYSRNAAPDAIREMAPDAWTAIVTATHDDDIDDDVVVEALGSDAGYIGVLGSARRIAPRRERLLAAGLPLMRINALHAPIGAVRSGKTPWEVAVSVIGEIMQVRADRETFRKPTQELLTAERDPD